MNERVLLCGYFGFANAGDEAILGAMLAALRERIPAVDVTVLSGDPAGTRRLHGSRAIHWIDVPAIIEAARAADLLVLGGGGLFHDYWGVTPSGALTHTQTGIAYWASLPLLASLAGKPCQIWGVGVGPLLTENGRALTRTAFDLAARASVRDEASRELLADLGISSQNVALTADPAWTLPPADVRLGQRLLKLHRVPPAGTLLGVAVRPWAQDAGEDTWYAGLAAQLDTFLDGAADRRVLFVPFQRLAGTEVDDRAASERVRLQMRQHARTDLLDAELQVQDVHALLATCDVVLAMRLHAAILSASAGIPIVAISYDAKVRSAMEALGAAEWIVALDAAGIGAISSLLERAVLQHHALAAGLVSGAQSFRTLANADADAAVDLLANPVARPLPASAGRWVLGALDTQARRIAGLPLPQDPTLRGMLEERTIGLRKENADLQIENQSLKSELDVLKRSRLWRTADLYWRARRALGQDAPAPGGITPSQERQEAAAPVENSPLVGTPPVADDEVPAPAATPMPAVSSIPSGFPVTPSGAYDVIVLSIIDWDFRFQRPQQLATQFARHGHRVFYLSTTRFLPPDGPPWALESKDTRVAELTLRTPSILDVYGGRLDDADVGVLEGALDELGIDLALCDPVCVLQIPFWTPLAERLRAHAGWRVVYDCMDEWTNFPGFGADVLALEQQLVEGADLTVVSAQRLDEKWRGKAKRLLLARNGVDLEHYERHFAPSTLLGDVAAPVIGYYGALASWVDVGLIEHVAGSFPEATIVLAGGHFDVDLTPLERLPNVRLLGQRPYAEMPELLWHFDVCLIPFVVNDITEATNPVKFYEYLSGGKPVVAPPLTELLPYRELCYLAEGREGTVEAIRAALAEAPDDPRREMRRQVAATNDWKARYVAIDEAVREVFPLISVVVVTHGGLDLTRDCIESLLTGETWPRLEVIVVDNASADGTVEWLQVRALRDARLRVIANPDNRGFPAANNQGIAAAAGEIVVLLNNDTVVPPGLLGRLTAHVADPSIGLVCPTTNFCGNEARVEAAYADISDLPRAAAERHARYAGRRFDLPVAAMYCVAARRAVLQRVGPLDEHFGIGMFEDDDYSERVRGAGLRVVCAEDAYVHHVGQGAFRHLAPERYKELWRQNQDYYERKWNRKWQAHSPRAGLAAAPSAFKGPA
jgi:polysaccharide pyruvyl transferase CsaB